jgi:hypothetical protein
MEFEEQANLIIGMLSATTCSTSGSMAAVKRLSAG